MRVVFGVLSLLLVVMIVGVLARKQLGAASAPIAAPKAAGVDLVLPAPTPGATPQQQSQQVQQQVKQSVEGLMQQARPMPEDK
ncbi:MAG TPA: hypothetical protein VLJ57_07685 [Burkholderiaceae bacterium]|nr:hypothetical protein [Burkholderiaceae bacterium]